MMNVQNVALVLIEIKVGETADFQRASMDIAIKRSRK